MQVLSHFGFDEKIEIMQSIYESQQNRSVVVNNFAVLNKIVQ